MRAANRLALRSVSKEVELAFVRVVHIDLISVWGIELGLISV